MVAKKYEKDISDEVKRKLISDAYRKAVDEQKLDVVGYPDIEEIQFGRGQVGAQIGSTDGQQRRVHGAERGVGFRRDDADHQAVGPQGVLDRVSLAEELRVPGEARGQSVRYQGGEPGRQPRRGSDRDR